MDYAVGLEAFIWGIGSAISLPLGAMLGLWWRPGLKINSSFMAFGAGALLFALTIELFGHVPLHVREHGRAALLVAVVCALLGGLLFNTMNNLLNNYGAFLRHWSNARKYVARLKVRRAKKLFEELRRIHVLRNMSAADLTQLIGCVQAKAFTPGQSIFRQGDEAKGMYFIVSGRVEILLHDKEARTLAILQDHDTFGELGVLTGAARTAEARAQTNVRVYKILKQDFDKMLVNSPELRSDIQQLADSHISEHLIKSRDPGDEVREIQTVLGDMPVLVSDKEIRDESVALHAGNAALAIWLGILIDGVPESLVIGKLSLDPAGMSLSFLAGVFLANMPEAMSSASSMRANGMSFWKVMWMWSSICLLTGIGAFVGAVFFPVQPTGAMFYLAIGLEGLAAGAMLTMIAETMLPEAFHQGGSIVGIATLAGFLVALTIKVL